MRSPSALPPCPAAARLAAACRRPARSRRRPCRPARRPTSRTFRRGSDPGPHRHHGHPHAGRGRPVTRRADGDHRRRPGAQRQTDRVADALREVPGISVSQSGAPGQLTSVFTRGLNSDQTQVLIDGIPVQPGAGRRVRFLRSHRRRHRPHRGRARPAEHALRSPRGGGHDPAFHPARRRPRPGASFRLRRLVGRRQFRDFPRTPGGRRRGRLPVSHAGHVPSRKDPGMAKASVGHRNAPRFVTGPGVFDYSLGRQPARHRQRAAQQRVPQHRRRGEPRLSPPRPDPRHLRRQRPADRRAGALFVLRRVEPRTRSSTRQPLDNLLTERQLYAPNLDWQLTGGGTTASCSNTTRNGRSTTPTTPTLSPGRRAGRSTATSSTTRTTSLFTRWLTLTTGAFYENVLVNQRRPLISQEFRPGGDVPQGFHGERGGVRPGFADADQEPALSSPAVGTITSTSSATWAPTASPGPI